MHLNTVTLLLTSTVLTSPLLAQNWLDAEITWLPDTTIITEIPGPGPGPGPGPEPEPHPGEECRCSPMFEDLALHVPFYNMDTFISHGIKFEVAPFQWSSGTFTTGGKVFADNALASCGTDQDLMTNNANVKVLFAEGVASSVYWAFGEYGGNINLEINGDFRNVDNYMDLDGLIVGGVTIQVLSGGFGDDCGCVQLRGMVYTLAVGGQEHWMDCLQYCCPEEHDEPNDIPGTTPGYTPGYTPGNHADDDHDDHGDDEDDDRDNDDTNDNFNGDHEDGHRKKGDVTRDGSTNLNDLLALIAKFGTDDADADLDDSGLVNMPDLIETLIGMQADSAQP